MNDTPSNNPASLPSPPASSSEGVETRAEPDELSGRLDTLRAAFQAKQLTAEYCSSHFVGLLADAVALRSRLSTVEANTAMWREVGGRDLANALRYQRELADDNDALRAEVIRLRASLAEEQRMSGPPENVTTIATDSGILVAVNADVYRKQGGL